MSRRRKGWTYTEEQLLINSYETNSIQELMGLFKNRSQDSINNKIKRLKASGKIKCIKSEEAIKRAYEQRL